MILRAVALIPRNSSIPRFALALGWLLALVPSALVAEEADKVLARVHGQEVTEAEIHQLLAGELLKLDIRRHEMISNAVTARVQEILVEREAARRGVSREVLMAAEVDGKAAAVPDAEVDEFYAARQAQIRQPKEKVEPQIRRLLAYQKLVAALEAGAEVEVMTEPYRISVGADGPSKGPEAAAVTIVEFGDFECPPCGQAYPVLKKIHETYPEDVRVVFRQFPLVIHSNARKAGEAALCANDQDKFWDMHDKMFENQKKLAVDGLKALASEIAELDEGKYAAAVESDFQDGSRLGVSGTPAFFLNGRFIQGVPSYEVFAEMIEEELSRRKGASGS